MKPTLPRQSAFDAIGYGNKPTAHLFFVRQRPRPRAHDGAVEPPIDQRRTTPTPNTIVQATTTTSATPVASARKSTLRRRRRVCGRREIVTLPLSGDGGSVITVT